MRIPLPTRIRFKHAVVFATTLFVIQQIEGSNLIFSALTWAFILISTIAFNAAGGFIYPSGWFVFFNALLTAILGLTFKALLGEQAETHLRAPNLTMLAYCVSMLLTVFVAMLTRKLAPRRALLAGMALGEDMRKAAFGAFLLGIALLFLSYTVQENGTFLSAVRQINFFPQMGVLLGTYYQVKKSRGAESTNWIVWGAGLAMFIWGGLLGFSKYGALVSVVTWLAAAIAAGHDFTRKGILAIVGFFLFFQVFLVPYSQVGRNLRADSPTMADDLKVARYALSHLGELRSQYGRDQKDTSNIDSIPHLYDDGEGFFDRLNMLSPDDAIIAYTADGNEEGLLPTYWAIVNVIPHFIWKDKPYIYIGNHYAREIGMIADDDEGTGVSFSPAADAYHQWSFYGIFLLVPPTLFLLFMVEDSLSGDIRQSPWGILFCVLNSHYGPEGMLGGQIYIATYAAFGVVVVALLSKYVLPVVSGVLINSDRTRVRRTVDFKPVLRPRSPQQDMKIDSTM